MLTHLYIPKLELCFSLDLPFSIEYMFIIFFPYLNSCKILPASINHPNFVFSIFLSVCLLVWPSVCSFVHSSLSLSLLSISLFIKQSKTLLKIKAKLQLIYLVILHLTKLVFSFLIDINCKCVFVYMFLLFVKGGTCLVSVIFICIDLGCPLKYG